MNEFITLGALYVLVLSGHHIPHFLAQWRERRNAKRRAADENAHTLDILSPLYREDPGPRTSFVKHCKRHAVAATAAVLLHPATIETGKHYAVHFVIYSGYVIRPH